MATVEAKNFSRDADEVATPNNARVETVNVLGQRVMRLTVQPGWKWSEDIKRWRHHRGLDHVSSRRWQRNHLFRR